MSIVEFCAVDIVGLELHPGGWWVDPAVPQQRDEPGFTARAADTGTASDPEGEDPTEEELETKYVQ